MVVRSSEAQENASVLRGYKPNIGPHPGMALASTRSSSQSHRS